MDDLNDFLPSGPNFSPLGPLAGPISYLIGIGLAIAAIAALIGLVLFLVRMGMAYAKGEPHRASEMGKGAAVSAVFLVGIVAFYAVGITLLTRIGNSIT